MIRSNPRTEPRLIWHGGTQDCCIFVTEVEGIAKDVCCASNGLGVY